MSQECCEQKNCQEKQEPAERKCKYCGMEEAVYTIRIHAHRDLLECPDSPDKAHHFE